VIAADASAIVAFFLKEDGWTSLSEYMKLVMTVDHAIKEFYNAVWKACRVMNLITPQEVEEIIALFQRYQRTNMIIEPEGDHIEGAFEIALREGLTVYDSLYIELAIKKRVPLLTLDEKQKSIGKKLGLETLP
jgi:predicted nucleic acid-binding protein